MNDVLVPEWMKKKREQDELAEAKAEARKQKMLAASTLIKAKMPEFCYAVKEKLAIAVECLSVLKLTGQITEFGGGYRVSVQHPGVFPNQTYTDVVFMDDSIRCTLLNGGVYKLLFCVVSDTEIGVSYMSEGGGTMNSEQTAEYIMRRMVEQIESNKC